MTRRLKLAAFNEVGPVTNIGMHHHAESRVLEVTGVNQRIEVDEGICRLCQPVKDKIAAEKGGTASNEDGNNYSTVTDFARFRGLSTSVPFTSAAW